MFHGTYVRRLPSGKYKPEEHKVGLSFFLERISIDYQFSRSGEYILNLQGGQLLGFFVPENRSVKDVVISLGEDYGFEIELEIGWIVSLKFDLTTAGVEIFDTRLFFIWTTLEQYALI